MRIRVQSSQIPQSCVGISAGRRGLSAAGVPPPSLPARCHIDLPESPQAAGPTCPNGDGRRRLPGHLPALVVAAGWCRRWPGRHVPRVAWPDKPPLRCGLFWQKNLEMVFFTISLVQVIQCVKNLAQGQTMHAYPTLKDDRSGHLHVVWPLDIGPTSLMHAAQ
jgi:hypothetical protein